MILFSNSIWLNYKIMMFIILPKLFNLSHKEIPTTYYILYLKYLLTPKFGRWSTLLRFYWSHNHTTVEIASGWNPSPENQQSKALKICIAYIILMATYLKCDHLLAIKRLCLQLKWRHKSGHTNKQHTYLIYIHWA